MKHKVVHSRDEEGIKVAHEVNSPKNQPNDDGAGPNKLSD